jgi:diguanylate cyclase (GGDEF)-like protein
VLPARLGGDEFLLIADSLAEDADEWAAGLATAVVDAVRRPIEVRAGVRIRVSASVGWAWLNAGDDAGDVLHSADTALYRAKAAGGNTAAAWGSRPPRVVAEARPLGRVRDNHPHRIPSELGVVIAR